MSQMSKYVLKTAVSDQNTLVEAIKLAAAQFAGMTCSVEGKDVVVRYKGIEQYRHNGNLKFKWAGATYEAIGDKYHTNGALEAVIEQITVAYRRAGVAKMAELQGTIVKEKIAGGMRIRLRTRK